MTPYFDEETHSFMIDKYYIPSVSGILRHSGICPPMDFIPAGCADRGSFVHAVTELVDQGICDYSTIPAEWMGYVSAYELFVEEMKPVVIESEKQVFNEELLYAGILDRIYEINGERVLTDIKTSTYTKWHKAQLTAYNLPLGQDICKVASLYLCADGTYKFKQYNEEFPYWREFQSACYLYWYKRERDQKMIRKILEELS